MPKQFQQYGAGGKDASPDYFQYSPPDPRDNGLKYGAYQTIRVSTGSNITIDDSQGAESITVEHASGTSIQFNPDGTSVLRSENDNFEIIMGNKTVVVQGTVNLVVNGDCNLKVEKDLNQVVAGDMHTTVWGNRETVIYGDDLTHVQGTKETTIAGAHTHMVDGPCYWSTMDRLAIFAQKKMKLFALDGSLWLQAGEDIRGQAGPWKNWSGKDSSKGNVVWQAAHSIDTKAGYFQKHQSDEEFTLSSTLNYVAVDGQKVFINSDLSLEPQKAWGASGPVF